MSPVPGDDPRLCSSNPRCAHLEGYCCPAETGLQAFCCIAPETSPAWSWLALAIGTTVLSLCLVLLAKVLPQAPAKFRRELAMAAISGLMYLAMAVPYFWESLFDSFTQKFQSQYAQLPFWYAVVITKSLGSFYKVASETVIGILAALMTMTLLNYLLPGGASSFSLTEASLDNSWTRWLGDGYKAWVAWVYSACFVYCIFLCRLSYCMKQFALGFFSTLIVEFMNPFTPPSTFRAILWNYDFHWQLKGHVPSMVYVCLLAVLLACLSLPILSCHVRWRRFFSARAMASRGLSKVGVDTWGTLERLITYFREDRSHFNVESSYFYIKQLGQRRVQIEALLKEASWECYNAKRRANLRGLERACVLLKDVRQGLRVQLEQVRGVRNNPAHVSSAELDPFLDAYCDAMKDAMDPVVCPAQLHGGLTRETLEEIKGAARAADAAVVEALQKTPLEHRRELVFLHDLRTFPALFLGFATELLENLECPPPPWCPRANVREWCPHRMCIGRERHLDAMRNSVSWLLALAWSTAVRRSSCLCTVSFAFSPTLGSLFHRNINRMLGVGIGVALGNLPAVLLLKPDCHKEDCFQHYPQGPIVYVFLMFLQWAVSMYGSLATGSQWSYACLLWAAYSSSQMLQGLHTPFGFHHTTSESELYVSMMDNMLGCMILFVVDIVASHLQGRRMPTQVASHLSECFTTLADLVSSVAQEGDFSQASAKLADLKLAIEGSRFCDEEARKEDYVWTSVRLMPYKNDLVDMVLREVDDAYLAMWSLLAIVQRSNLEHDGRLIVRENVPKCLPQRCRVYAQVLRAAVCEKRGQSQKVEGVAPDKHFDSKSSGLPLESRQFASPKSGPLANKIEAVNGPQPEENRPPPPTTTERSEVLLNNDPVTKAPALAIRSDCLALRLAMQRVQALLEEHTFWEAHEWRASAEEREEQGGPEENPRTSMLRSTRSVGSRISMDLECGWVVPLATSTEDMSQLAPNDKLDLRLDDKTLAVIEEAYLDPLPLSSTDTQGGPGPDNGVHKLSHFKEYLVEVGDPVTLGDPIATITDSHGHEHKLTATATGAVTARQEDLKKGDPVMKVVDLVLITVGPFPALGPLTKSNVQAGLVEHPEGKTLKEFKVKTGEIVKTGDVIAVVQDSEGNEEEVKASHGGIVTDLQKLPPGTPLTQVEDGNLATTGKFPPLATESDKDHPVLLSQVNNPPEFEHAASDDQKEKDESSDKAKTPVDLRSLKFVEYKVKVGLKVEDGDPLAVVEDKDGKLHTIVAPAPGTVKRIQEKLQRGHLVGRVLESGDLAVIGPLPTREQEEFTTGVYAPSEGPWVFEEWKADVGENVDRNTTIAILKNEETGELKEVKAAKGGNLAWRRDELKRGDEVESATEDDMLATVGRLPEPSMNFREIGAQAPVDATFDEWKIKEGQRVHFGDPVAQVTLGGRRLVQADGTVRRLAGTTHTIPSPGTGWISYMADLKPGESIKQQSAGPTIAKVYMGVPWWLTLLGSLMALCCCFGCLFKIMKKPKPTYQPMPPVEAEPEPPEPKPETPPPEPEPVPEGLRLDFDDRGTVRTVYCKYRPLGIKHNHKAPIIAHDFTVNSYAKMELGVKDGWKLTRIADEELNDSPNFDEINEKLAGYMKEFPLWPLPLEFLTDAKQPSTAVVKSFLQRPLGLEFSNVAPIQVGKIYEDSPAASMGVVVGWQLTKIGSFDVHENHNFREVMKYFKEGVQPLQDTGKKYGS